MQPLFASPLMYWVGMTTRADTPPDELAAFNNFYSHTHAPEVLVRNPGFVRATRYELIGPDPRGDLGPGWLAVYDLEDEAAARAYEAVNDGPADGRPAYSAGPPAWQRARRDWRFLWRQVAAVGRPSEAPYAIYLVGMNIPAETDAAGLAAFNAFYTDVHVPEVVAAGGYTSGTRFERYRDFKPEEARCPRFLAVYQADQAATERLLHRASSAVYSSGPPAWEQHETLWRLVYRRINAELSTSA
jgi:hypothetical protein